MIELKEIRKSYTVASFVQTALDGVSLAFRDNEFVAVLGPSGSGKTTLLNILGGLDHADSGDIVINGVSTQQYKDADWDTYRNHRIGFIFQSYNLIPHQTICANVELALTLSGVPAEERKTRAIEALKKVGLGDHVDKKPSQLSGGQMQRVAIARALINDPDIVLADEPTGALDTETGIQVMDLLSEIAQDRLVIMVTHNPELAEQYANRIVRLSDGRITGDTNPLGEEEIANLLKVSAVEAGVAAAGDQGGFSDEQVQAELDRDAAKGSKKHASMSFATALSLSFNNLMTKKARTFLTAFAGSIGIIGIAAILALSNGVNNYIAKTEGEALSSFPLTITKSSLDIAGLFTMDSEDDDGDDGEEKKKEDPNNIRQISIMTDMFAEVKNNDLSSFKKYLDSGDSGIEQHVSAIQYSYDIEPLIYSVDTSDGIHQLSPSKAGNMLSSGMASSAFSMGSSGMDSFQHIIDDKELVENQMDVVRGHWPEKYDEAVLVLSGSGYITDYTLYSIGIYDSDKLESMFRDVLAGEEVNLPKVEKDFSYDDAMGMTFSVVSPSATYQKSGDGNTWTDMSGDSDFMKKRIEEGVKLKIVGIVQPKDGKNATMLSEGIAYSSDLEKHLMDQAAESQVVKDQMADPERDIFTGKTFKELEEDEGSAFDMDSIFTIDEAALQSAFSFDTSALSGMGSGMDLSGAIDPSAMSGGIDPNKMMESVDTSVIQKAMGPEAIQKIMAHVPPFTFSGSGITDESGLTEAQKQAVNNSANALAGGYAAWVMMNPGGTLEEYMATAEAKAIIAGAQAAVEESYKDSVGKALQSYMTNLYAPYVEQAMAGLVNDAAQLIALQMAEAMYVQIAAMTDSLGSTLANAISGQLSASMSQLGSALQNGFSFNADAFAGAFQFNLSEEDLASLMTSFMNAEELSYENNLAKLGYADRDNPSSIAIFPKNFEAKDEVKEVIDNYNREAEKAGEEERSIDYNDMAGILMSSVNNIVNMISLVLIAFVSISLVVSSIMIGIITYISVLERKKEIGILRAIGASKGNIANVFNAETIIEGLLAGVFAIGVVYLVSIPVNMIVYDVKNVDHILSLPFTSALILIGVSVFLTFIAGLIPSTAASRRDPVEALRSE